MKIMFSFLRECVFEIIEAQIRCKVASYVTLSLNRVERWLEAVIRGQTLFHYHKSFAVDPRRLPSDPLV